MSPILKFASLRAAAILRHTPISRFAKYVPSASCAYIAGCSTGTNRIDAFLGVRQLYCGYSSTGGICHDRLPNTHSEDVVPAYSEASPINHTMGNSLLRYLSLKIHPEVHSCDWERLVVIGKHDRSSGSEISHKEKGGKPYNWMRPTARLAGTDLLIQAFPGPDHIQHYAALLSTYLKITGASEAAKRVFYAPSSPSDTVRALVEDTNLLKMPRVDTVVTGLVHRLEPLTGPPTAYTGDANDTFSWTVRKNPHSGHTIAFLGCRFSFWGSIAGDLVRVLANRLGVQRVVYFGKLGVTDPAIAPNQCLASGNYSEVCGKDVYWDNILSHSLSSYAGPARIIMGRHETVPSVLYETKDWLAGAKARGNLFVDPELGCMATAANESGIRFGYLHIISDNVAEKYDEDLSNERDTSVLTGRARLYHEVNNILGGYLMSL